MIMKISINYQERYNIILFWLIDINFLIKFLSFQKLLFLNREEIKKLETISTAKVNQIKF
jgi:hypothetical protein